jgi:spore coat protein U-like protein
MKIELKSVCLKLALFLAAGALINLDASPAHALDTDTEDLEISATVSANCTITTTPVAFGAYDPVSANASSVLDGAGKVTVTCTNGSSGTITLGEGINKTLGSLPAVPVRRMTDDGTNYLSYGLFTNFGRTLTWGDTALTGVVHNGDGTATDIDVFGQMAAGQNKPAGVYGDTVLATVTF